MTTRSGRRSSGAGTRRPRCGRGFVAVLAAVVLLGGCTAEDRESIVDGIQDIIGSASPEPTPEPSTEPTEEPTTEASPTEEPTATEEPTPEATEEPTPEATEEPTEEPAPTEEPSEEPAPTEEPTPEDATGDEGLVAGLPWWVPVLGLLLLALLVWLLRRRRRTVIRRQRLLDTVLDDADWLLGRAHEQPAAVDAGARARDIRLRGDRLQEDVQQLRAAAPRAADAGRDLQTSAHQLGEALIQRLDDVARTGVASTGLGVAELAGRVRSDRDALAAALGRRPSA